MKLHLTTRIVFFIVLLSAVLLVTVGLFSYRSGRESLKSAAVSEMLGDAIEKEAQVDAWLGERKGDLSQLASRPDVVDAAATLIALYPPAQKGSANHEYLLHSFYPTLSSYESTYIEIFLMDPKSGKVVVSTSPSEEGKIKLGYPYFSKGKASFYLQTPYRSTDFDIPLMTQSTPLLAANGRVVAVLAARLNLAVLNAIVQRSTGLHKTQDSFLFNAEQFAVTQPLFIREPAMLNRKFTSEAVRRAVSGNSDVIIAPDYRGVTTIAAYRWINKYQLGIVVKVDESEELAPARVFGWEVFLVSVLALLVAASLSFFLARTITKPLRVLHNKMRCFGEGKTSYSLGKFSGDEVIALENEYGQMAMRIGERTSELIKTNEDLQAEIAAREQAEKNEVKYFALIENSDEFISMASPKSGIFYLNPSGRRMAGIAKDANIASIDWRNLFDEKNWKIRTEVAIPTIMSTGRWNGDIQMRNLQTGQMRDLHVYGFQVKDPKTGSFLCIGTVQLDITEVKRAAEVLRKNEHLLSESQRLGHIGSWLFDMKGPISWSDEMYRLFDVSPDTFIPTAESFISLLHPEDRPAMQAWIAACALGEKPGELESRVILPDGTLRYLIGHGAAVRDSVDRFIHMAGTVQDITSRKRAELDREKFVALIENSPDFIGMASIGGKPFYMNKAGRVMLGLDPDFDISTLGISDCYDGETTALLMNTGIPASFTVGHWAGEGKLCNIKTQALVPVHIHSFLVRNTVTKKSVCLATIQRNITDIKEAEAELAKVQSELVEASRLSGMAEIATSVLHNVGNVLNSVNVSTDRIAEKLNRLRPASLEKVATMLQEHKHDLPDFLGRDPQGKELPGYLSALVEQLADPQKDILPEVVSLRKNIEHIRAIVRLQQDYASATSVLETMAISDLAEDAIRITAASLTRHEVQLIREYSPVPSFPIEKHKVLQILVNLLSNAKYAMDATGRRDGKLTVRIARNGGDIVRLTVMDNGEGIAPVNLTRVFQHGFTTRKDGHGFGLHSGALSAKEMGGSLTAYSEGPGKGAVFTLELPCRAQEVRS